MRGILALMLIALIAVATASPVGRAAIAYVAPSPDCLVPPLEVERRSVVESPCGAALGDPVGDIEGGAPEGEYIDPVTNVVYRLEDGRLEPAGVALTHAGYVSVHAYRNGHYSGDVPTDFGCVPDAALQGSFCGACPSDHCATWRVALAGSYPVRIVETWTNQPTPTCNPAQPLVTHSQVVPAPGGPVTSDAETYHREPPFTSCGVGVYRIELFLGNDRSPIAFSETTFGPPYPSYPCVNDTIYFAQYGLLYGGSCVPCWREIAGLAPGTLHVPGDRRREAECKYVQSAVLLSREGDE